MSPSRYTRLKAIKEFGYDIDWKDLFKFHVGIIGVGGLGSVSAEMIARCGVGKITLFDFDTVEVVNLNRHMFKNEHIGQLKVKVAAEILKEINPDVELQYFDKDIMDINFESEFESQISQMDIILNGLDNKPAREYLNIKCVKLNIPYIDAGASRSGLSGYVHPVIPHKTACATCMSSITLKVPKEKGEPCTASLPSTMAILASIQVQEMLKYLLKFGQMIDYVMYHMITGNFLSYKTIQDENCPICGDKSKASVNSGDSSLTNEDLNDIIDKIKD